MLRTTKPDVSNPKYPPVDKLKAVILERKLVMGLTYDDLAKVANTSSGYLRQIMIQKRTDDWNPEMRKAICRELGINVKVSVQDLYQLEDNQ